MSNSGKVWDIREAYKQSRNNAWETPGNRGMRMGGQTTPAASDEAPTSPFRTRPALARSVARAARTRRWHAAAAQPIAGSFVSAS